MHEFTQQSMRSLLHLTRFVFAGITQYVDTTLRGGRVYHHQTETKHTQERNDLFALCFHCSDSLWHTDINGICNSQTVDCLQHNGQMDR